MNKNIDWIMNWADRMVEKFGQPDEGFDWIRNIACAASESGADQPSPEAIALAVMWEKAKFGNTSCSQCGKWFGPGNHGFSHCKDHRNKKFNIELNSDK